MNRGRRRRAVRRRAGRAAHDAPHLEADLHRAEGDVAVVARMTGVLHTHGVAVAEDFIAFHFDGAAIRRSPTPEEAKAPPCLMVALGGGRPIDRAPEPSVLPVDRIRARARK